jgi:uncharacterized protein
MSLRATVLLSFSAALWSGVSAAAETPGELHAVPPGRVKLLASTFAERAKLNRDYVAGLKNEDLLQNFYLEAGLWSPTFRMTGQGEQSRGDDIHWGWESPTCQVRGHFLGHWLSAAAYIAASTPDPEVRGKAERIVSELARIQEANGGRWVASIPQQYLFWIAQKKPVWAPHYTVHKTFMGLLDAYSVGGNKQALAIAENFALWFADWTSKFSREEMDEMLDVETGGMIEVWADLYGITGKPVYRELMTRYNRPRLFERLLAGEDPLTNKHANTTIPEAQGAARAYEVTGEAKWRDIAQAYWRSAVTNRGAFATGGQTNGEIWTPPMKLSARLSATNQEHCVVYNMIRLADYLFRWTGDVQYADYIERNIYNGILAQQHPQTGMVAYFLPLAAGSHKVWGSRTNDFWCCHGSLVQAQSRHDRYIYYTGKGAFVVAQYIPSEVSWEQNGTPVRLVQTMLHEAEEHRLHVERDPSERPNHWAIDIKVAADKPVEFALKLRMPWWLRGKPGIIIDGKTEAIDAAPSSFVVLRRVWNHNRIRLVLPKGLSVSPLPDRPDTVAFMDGPVVLAGLTGEEQTLQGNASQPESILAPDDEREWSDWLGGYRTVNQDRNFRLVPLNTVTDQTYTVYFPIRRTP